MKETIQKLNEIKGQVDKAWHLLDLDNIEKKIKDLEQESSKPNFWDNTENVIELYGNNTESKNEEKSYFVFREKGLGVELLEDEVRTMFIFQPQMK